MFNSKEYSWSNVHILAFGRRLMEAKAVEYKQSREKELIFAAGDKPRGIGYGNKSYSGTLTLLQSGVEALNKLAKDNGYEDITDIEFDLVVAYVPPAGLVTTDTLKYVSITEIPKGMKQGDKFMEVALPFIMLGIE